METPVALGLAFAKTFQAPRALPRSCSDSVPVLDFGVIGFVPSKGREDWRWRLTGPPRRGLGGTMVLGTRVPT